MDKTCIEIEDKWEVIDAIFDDNLDGIEKKEIWNWIIGGGSSMHYIKKEVYTLWICGINVFNPVIYWYKWKKSGGANSSSTLNQLRRSIQTSYLKSLKKTTINCFLS